MLALPYLVVLEFPNCSADLNSAKGVVVVSKCVEFDSETLSVR